MDLTIILMKMIKNNSETCYTKIVLFLNLQK